MIFVTIGRGPFFVGRQIAERLLRAFGADVFCAASKMVLPLNLP